MSRALHLLPLMFLLAACGASKTTRENTSSARYSYKLSEEVNGVKCNTGRISATTVQVLCQALGDKEANQNCAAEQRLELQRTYKCSNLAPVSVSHFYFGKCEERAGLVFHVDSKESLCEALKSELLNGGCGKADREAKAQALGC